MALVLKIWPTGLAPRLGLGVDETRRAIDLDVSVSETKGNHTDLAKPD